MINPPKRCHWCGVEIPDGDSEICDDCYDAYCRMVEEELARDAKESEAKARRDAELRREVFGDPYD